ncbi:MAG TPA: urease accessory protein UreD [Burkholderiaceae bacterium]
MHAAQTQGWEARLKLGFTRAGAHTRLSERSHSGPLRVQKALYPEGADVCHAVLLHPPGGIAGGDSLSIAAHAGPGAHALLTTPGAGKWYRAAGRQATQEIALRADAGAVLEWLPQETLFYDAADCAMTHDVALHGDAVYIGSEILCFGRTASGETYASGQVRQRTSVRRDGALLWYEQGLLRPSDGAMHSRFGLAGHTVCATLLAAGRPLTYEEIRSLRGALHALDAGPQLGATQLKQMLAVRYLGQSSETAKAVLSCAWHVLRPLLAGRAASVPRLWHT